MNPFSFSYLRGQYQAALDAGYTFLNCRQYCDAKAGNGLPEKFVINRIDIDVSVKKADRLREIYADLGIPATFFVRLHAKEYNPFDFENYRILKAIQSDGHEIGYHSEIVDQAKIWGEDVHENLLRDLSILSQMLGEKVMGVASHGGFTGFNNLDFWKGKRAADLGVLYEAYEEEGAFNLFNHSLYVTDSEWTQWKAYRDGRRLPDDRRSLVEHLESAPEAVYLLIHPETYYDRHVYDG